jgi:competence protein ComEC
MQPIGVYLVLCGYIIGLLIAPGVVWPWGLGWLLGGWLVGAIVPRVWRRSPQSLSWVGVGIAGFLAGIYLQVRQPLPMTDDISHSVAAMPPYSEVQVRGTLQERPQITRAGKARFPLAVDQLTWIDDQSTEQTQTVSGSVYTTLPLLQTTGLGNGDRAEITGRLYLPTPPTNPGQFDFRQFLAQRGMWAGLVGESVNWETVEDRSSWLETIRDRIVKAHVEGLGVPSGLLMSVMTMGYWGVDLPYDLRDRFTDLGLAHALSASGFHVGIILNSVLKWAGGSPRFQFGVGSVTLVLYSALAGFQPSVCRAAFMGWAGVLGRVVRRRVRSSGTLLAIATLLLLWNPLLIQNLSFQLSFLATFGLIVATEPVTRFFSFLPLWLAQSLSIPIAATLWTLPLQIYVFNVVSPIAIPVNLVVGELLSLITTVGFFSGMVAVASPAGGSFLARGLAYPMQWMITGLTWLNDHLGRVWFVSQITLGQMVALYAVLFGLWLWRSQYRVDELEEEDESASQELTPSKSPSKSSTSSTSSKSPLKTRRSIGLVGSTIAGCALWVLIVVLPGWLESRDRLQVYVLDETSEPVLVVRDRAETVLIGNGTQPETATFTLLPLFRSLGVNQLALAIEPTPVVNTQPNAQTNTEIKTGVDDPTWGIIADQVPIAQWIDGTTMAEPMTIAQETITVIPLDARSNLALRLGNLVQNPVDSQDWLVLRDASEAAIASLQAELDDRGIRPEVVCWSGEMIADLTRWDWPLVGAIAVDRLDPVMASTLAAQGVTVWETRQGAVVAQVNHGGEIRRAIGDRGATEWDL